MDETLQFKAFNGIMKGGKRPGAGRPSGTRTVTITTRITPAAAEKLRMVKNQSEFIDKLILWIDPLVIEEFK